MVWINPHLLEANEIQWNQRGFQVVLAKYNYFLLCVEDTTFKQIFLEAYAAAAKSLQSCPTLCDLIDGSPSGSTVHRIFQARVLEWVAISFSNAWKWKVKVKSLSCVRLFATTWTAAYQAPPSMGFSRQEYWSGVPLPSLLEAYTHPQIIRLTHSTNPPCPLRHDLISYNVYLNYRFELNLPKTDPSKTIWRECLIKSGIIFLTVVVSLFIYKLGNNHEVHICLIRWSLFSYRALKGLTKVIYESWPDLKVFCRCLYLGASHQTISRIKCHCRCSVSWRKSSDNQQNQVSGRKWNDMHLTYSLFKKNEISAIL